MREKTIEELDRGRELKNLKKIEAALFISGRFLSLQELVTLTDINPILLRQLLEKLEESYAKKDSAIGMIKRGDNWKMDVKPEYVYMVSRIATGSAEFSKAEQETLAVIAYKQPVKQSVIVKIRGNKAYDHIKKFIQLGLIRGKKMGHTKELRLSEEFYDYFHVSQAMATQAGPEQAYVAGIEEVKREIENKKIGNDNLIYLKTMFGEKGVELEKKKSAEKMKRG